MESLQMVKQEEMGREGRPRHRARDSPSSAEGWPKSCSRQSGRDSCCGGGRLQRERNSLETALFYTLISHRSCLGICLWEAKAKVCRTQGETVAEKGTLCSIGLPCAPTTILAPSQQGRGVGLQGMVLQGFGQGL